MSQLQIFFEDTKYSDSVDMNVSESETPLESNFSSSSDLYTSTMLRVNSLLTGLPNSTIGNLTNVLNDLQISQLAGTESDSGISCLLNMWFRFDEGNNTDELRCPTVWDNVYCWPSTLAGTTSKIPCAKVLHHIHQLNGRQIIGFAFRTCLKNGTWSRGIRSNYSECAKALLQSNMTLEEEDQLSVFVQYMVFSGSIASLLCLVIALAVMYSFRSVWSERIKVHVHLMLSLVLRFIVFLIISEPIIFQRGSSYRDYNILCKTVLTAHLYATVTSTSWMFVQGIYLNGKLTTNVFGFGKKREFLKFYIIGWGLPAILLVIYLIAMIANQHSENCWQGYAGMTEIWILLIPIKAEMLLTGLLLCNILRVVITKRRVSTENSEFTQLKSVAKVTLFLFPILGLNNLLFLYNPGGEYETLYVSLNISFGSTQGVLVALVYCFNCTEVHQAIRRSYNRFFARRSAYNMASDSRNHVAMIVLRDVDVVINVDPVHDQLNVDHVNGNNHVVGSDEEDDTKT